MVRRDSAARRLLPPQLSMLSLRAPALDLEVEPGKDILEPSAGRLGPSSFSKGTLPVEEEHLLAYALEWTHAEKTNVMHPRLTKKKQSSSTTEDINTGSALYVGVNVCHGFLRLNWHFSFVRQLGRQQLTDAGLLSYHCRAGGVATVSCEPSLPASEPWLWDSCLKSRRAKLQGLGGGKSHGHCQAIKHPSLV